MKVFGIVVVVLCGTCMCNLGWAVFHFSWNSFKQRRGKIGIGSKNNVLKILAQSVNVLRRRNDALF